MPTVLLCRVCYLVYLTSTLPAHPASDQAKAAPRSSLGPKGGRALYIRAPTGRNTPQHLLGKLLEIFNCNRVHPVVKGFTKTNYSFLFLYTE